MGVVFSSDQVRPDDRFSVWDQRIKSICGNFSTELGRPEGDFRGLISVESIAGMDFATIASNAKTVRRTRRDTATSDDRYCFLVMQLEGRSIMAQCGEEAVLGPGDMTLIDSSLPSKFSFDGDVVQLSLHIPRDQIRNRIGSSAAFNTLTARTIAGQRGIGAIVRDYILSLRRNAHLLTAAEAGTVRDCLLALIVTALRERGGDMDTGHCSQTLASHWSLIQQFIDAHLQDPELTPTKIAQSYGISLRHLHRVFSANGHTVGDWVRLRRLQRCQEELASPRSKGASLTRIAYRWGFNDSSHFSRAFKVTFGMSPRDYRNAMLGQAGTNPCSTT